MLTKAIAKVEKPFTLAVWFLLGLAVQKFAVDPATATGDAVFRGALVGFIIYGVYDFTNWTTINLWTSAFAVQDIAWGTVLSATVAGLSSVLQKKNMGWYRFFFIFQQRLFRGLPSHPVLYPMAT